MSFVRMHYSNKLPIKSCVTYQNSVAISTPTPIQSTNITHNKNLIKDTIVNLNTKAKPTEETKN